MVYMLTLGVYWWDPCYHIYQHHGSYGYDLFYTSYPILLHRPKCRSLASTWAPPFRWLRWKQRMAWSRPSCPNKTWGWFQWLSLPLVYLWFTLVYLGLPLVYLWFTLVYLGLPWFTLVYLGLPWFILVYLGLSWFIFGPGKERKRHRSSLNSAARPSRLFRTMSLASSYYRVHLSRETEAALGAVATGF